MSGEGQGAYLGTALGIAGMSPACSLCSWLMRFGDAEEV